MKTDCFIPDEGRPAKAKAKAGRKPVPLTAAEIQRQRERLMAISDEEKEDAMAFLGKWIVGTIKKRKFNFQNGPFCYEEMHGDAVKVISWDSYNAIFYGERRWPKKIKLSTMLIGIARSKMDHIIRSYASRIGRVIVSTDDMTGSLEKEVEEAVGVFSIEMNMRDLGFEMAINACRGKPLFLRYLQLLQECNDYDYIKDKLDISLKEVFKLEADLLRFLEGR